jgi:hypothetical protein
MGRKRILWDDAAGPPPEPSSEDRRRGAPWPPLPDRSITFPTPDGDHHVTLELVETSEGPIVVGLAVRRTTPLEPEPPGEDIRPGSTKPALTEEQTARRLDYQRRRNKARRDKPGAQLFGAEPRPVSPRDVRRLPLGSYVRAAQAIASARFFPVEDYAEDVEKARRILLPRGRPQRGKGTKFYEEIARAYEQLAARGKNPAVEIAKRKSRELGEEISTNTVHQWIFRARGFGFLDKPQAPERRRRGR